MGNESGSILKVKGGRLAGAIIGLVVGLLVIIPKVFFLFICILIGYFIGKYFDEKKQ